MSDRSLSRRDFLRLRRSERGKVLELSCRTLFMRCSDAAAPASAPAGPDDDAHTAMGEPPARLQRRSANELIDALEEELRDVQTLRLIDPEWLDSIQGAARVEAVIDEFRLRGGLVERAI
jgi:hypothetical protein